MAPRGRPKHKRVAHMPDELRARIRAAKLIDRLQAHIFDGLELSVSQVNGIRILLQKCLPDLTAVAVKAEVTHRFVAHLTEPISREAWLKKYSGDYLDPDESPIIPETNGSGGNGSTH